MFLARISFFIVLFLGSSFQALSQCSGSINISSPAEGASVTSHFEINAVASSACPITSVQVYLNNQLQFTQFDQPVLSGKFNAGIGRQDLVVQAWTPDGKTFKKLVHITVSQQVASTCNPSFDPNVAVCAPVNLAESKGPVLIHAAARSSVSPVVRLQTFIGGKLKAVGSNGNALEMEATLTLPRGIQNINVVATTYNGSQFQNQANVQVVSAATNCQIPFLSNVAPTAGDAPEFPPFLAAADAAACPISTFNVYVDDLLFYSQSNQKLFEGRLTIPPGGHSVVLQAWNSQGTVGKRAIQINVTGTAEPTCIPSPGQAVTVCLSTQVVENNYVAISVGTPATPPSPFTALRIYVDTVARATFYGSATESGIAFQQMKKGTHKVKAVAWTQKGDVVTTTQTVIVP